MLKLKTDDWERLVDRLVEEKILCSPEVIGALRSIPRAAFLPDEMRSYSATDSPLPIGLGQTISAPHSLSTKLG